MLPKENLQNTSWLDQLYNSVTSSEPLGYRLDVLRSKDQIDRGRASLDLWGFERSHTREACFADSF